ncbi:MAG: type II toxin-antitoxin system RelE/ParE family toxin [bacterium]|nr:type II toxin-antitoxin system RelE/ParE family toxin [bacterium]
MSIRFSKTAKNQLHAIKSYIARDNPEIATNHIKKVMHHIRKVLEFPNVGKVNNVYKREDIREIAIEGYKVIYQIGSSVITILAVYKNIDFDEGGMQTF